MKGASGIAAMRWLADLLHLILRPGPRFHASKRAAYADRVQSKGWLTAWSSLREAERSVGPCP